MTRNNYSQTTIVDEVKGSIVNEVALPSEVAFGLTNIWKLPASLNTILTFDLCRAHISNNRPFIVFIRWSSGSAHFTVYDGYETNPETIRIIDPGEGKATDFYSYEDAIVGCAFASGVGKWSNTVELI